MGSPMTVTHSMPSSVSSSDRRKVNRCLVTSGRTVATRSYGGLRLGEARVDRDLEDLIAVEGTAAGVDQLRQLPDVRRALLWQADHGVQVQTQAQPASQVGDVHDLLVLAVPLADR